MPPIKSLYVFLSLFSVNSFADAQTNLKNGFTTLTDNKFERQLDLPSSSPVKSPYPKDVLESFAKAPFDIGERMRFAITYLGVTGGSAELIVREPIQWKDNWAYRFTGEVKSADWASWFVTVHEAVECVTDHSDNFVPRQFYLNQIENKFFQSKIIQFFPEQKKIIQVTKRKDKDQKTEEFPFDKAQDAVGALYYLRNKLGSGSVEKTFEFPVFTSEKTWQAKGTFVKREKIKVEGNEFDTDLFDLRTHFGKSLEQKGKIKVWFTHDTRALPVLVEAEVLFGAVKLSLVEWDQGNVQSEFKRRFPPITQKK